MDSYIEYLLLELMSVINKLIIVVNGNITENGYNTFLKYTDQIIIRNNEGFDAGAYVDVLLNHLGEDGLKEWNELVLCNDTFYGPFISMREIFITMSKSNADFWGLNVVERKILGYIQSYFLVFRKKILTENVFLDYLKKNIRFKEKKIESVYATFESGLYHYLIKNNYKGDTYTNVKLHDVYRNAYTCMQKYKLPIMKKKCMSLNNNDLSEMLRALNYIANYTIYPIDKIIENARRQYAFLGSSEDVYSYIEQKKEKEIIISNPAISEKELLEWVGNDPFYIYGEGAIARQLYKVYFENVHNFMGFIVSNDQNIQEKEVFQYPVNHIGDIDMAAKIVLGVGKKNMDEVVNKIDLNNKILCLWK